MMKLKSKILAIGSAVAMAAVATSADAATLFSGQAVFNLSAPSPLTGQSLGFKFIVPDALSSSATSTDLSFAIGAGPTFTSAASVKFDDISPSSVLDTFTLSTTLGSDVYSLYVFGGDVFTPNVNFLTPSGAAISADLFLNSVFVGKADFGFVSLTSVADVPEPATWAMMMLGLGAVGFSLRQRRRQNVSFGGYAVA